MLTDTPGRFVRRFYLIGAGLLLAWATALLIISVTVVPDAYWYSYYSVDYTIGFVRRGLAGELVSLFPPDQYFPALRAIRWIPTLFYVIGLLALAMVVALRFGCSERRLMLALLIPVLPFGLAFGIFSARPDLLGGAALIAFAVALCFLQSPRSVIIAALMYGIALCALTLAHEAIPLLFSAGAVAAVIVLARDRSISVQRWTTALAIGPGLVTTAIVAAFGRRGVSAQLCDLIPHGPVNHPLAGHLTFAQIIRGTKYEVDYHDWMCRSMLPLYDQNVADAVSFVRSIGFVGLAASTLLGVVILVVSILSISHIAGTPFSLMWELLRKRPSLTLLGFLLILPIFATGVDWTRWWVMFAFDIGMVFLLYAAGGQQATRPATRRTRLVFVAGVVLLALIPLGVIPSIGAPVPM